jgi:hypothetical protein
LGQPTKSAHLGSPPGPIQNGVVAPSHSTHPHSLSLSLTASLANPNPRRFGGDRVATMVAAVFRPTQTEPSRAVVLVNAARDGASARPSGFVYLVLVCARACAVLADADGSVAISVDLLFLATPGCSPPSLVMCVAWHGPGRGLAPPWLACATVSPCMHA